MHHTVAFTELLGTTANTDIDALSDDILIIQNTHFLPQVDYDIWWAYLLSATLNRVRLASPKVRQVTNPFLRPIDRSTLPTDRHKIVNMLDNPFRIRGLEEFAIEATSDIAMGTERFTGIFALGGQREPAPRGDVYNLRLTSTNAAVANAWTTLAVVTPADVLPAGSYAVIGAEAQSTNMIAFRLIFENQVMRPGAVGITAIGNKPDDIFRYGGLGVWGRFTSTRLPQWQVLCNAADASFVFQLDIVRIG